DFLLHDAVNHAGTMHRMDNFVSHLKHVSTSQQNIPFRIPPILPYVMYYSRLFSPLQAVSCLFFVNPKKTAPFPQEMALFGQSGDYSSLTSSSSAAGSSRSARIDRETFSCS